MKIFWQWKKFQDFNDPAVLYAVLKLRSQVFVVEQRSLYLDPDGQDPNAMHLLGYSDEHALTNLQAYARLFTPTSDNNQLRFGRVVVDSNYRGQGVGEQIIEEILAYIKASSYQGRPIHISAQHYLIEFYQKFGFVVKGEPYDEDGILHVSMVL